MKPYQDKIYFLPPRKLATNNCYTLAINDFGELYSWGNNKEGRLGHLIEPGTSDIIEHPRKYDFFSNNNQKCLEISCGANHIAAVVLSKNENGESGHVYTWGLSLYGRLGYLEGDEEEEENENEKKNKRATDEGTDNQMIYKHVPHIVQISERVTRVSCGNDFTAAITEKGKLFTWGTNRNNYLGIDSPQHDNPVVTTPAHVTTLLNHNVIQVACGSKHMICLTSEGHVFSWGSGENGMLGHNNTSSYDKPEIISELKSNYDIIFIAAGDFASAAISSEGHLFMWGRGKYGILGQGSEENIIVPTWVNSDKIKNEKIFFVSLGFYHTLALSVDRKAFAWGYSEKGRLGCIDRTDCEQKKRITLPREIISLHGKNLSQIFAGHYHSFAISADGGKLWGWGENVDCILGITDVEMKNKRGKKVPIYTPIELPLNKNLIRISGHGQDMYETYFNFAKTELKLEITDLKKFVKLECGGTHTLGLTGDGDVYAWGFGEDGQLGQKENNKISSVPSKVHFIGDRKMKKIYAGYSNSLAISINGECFIWGDGKYGQLCKEISTADEPSLIDDFNGRVISKASLGFNSCAAIVDAKLYMWGCNDNGKLGLNKDDVSISKPCIVAIEHVKSISCGMEHTAALNQNGDIFTWGRGFYGQLGHGDQLPSYKPKRIESVDSKFSKVKCGSDQTLAIDKKGSVYVWGRGGFNLLNEPNRHAMSPSLVTFFKGQKAKKIQAGYGNSHVLLHDKTAWGWGDNTYGKICDDVKLLITGNPRQTKIKLETGNQGELKQIENIFCACHHCYLITSNWDTYGWGCFTCYRLTSDYGDIQLREPKLLTSLTSVQSSNFRSSDEFEDEQAKEKQINTKIDERFILMRLRDKHNIPSFPELVTLIENHNPKYDDKKLIQNDEDTEKLLYDELSKIASLHHSKQKFDSSKFLHIDKLINIRLRALSITKKKIVEKMMPIEIAKNVDEIEKIYTMFYLHPCLFKEYFIDDNLHLNGFHTFFNGVKPLFADLQSFSTKAVSYENILYLIFFKTLMREEVLREKKESELTHARAIDDIPAQIEKQIDKLYVGLVSYSEILLDSYFTNSFGRNVLLDIFSKTLRYIMKISRDQIEANMKKRGKYQNIDGNKNIVEHFERLRFIFLDPMNIDTKDQDQIKEDEIDTIVHIMEMLLNDIEGNITLISPYIAYCLTSLKRKYYRVFVYSKYGVETKPPGLIKRFKEKIKKAILRLFFKNVIAKMLKSISATNKMFIQQLLRSADDQDYSSSEQIFLSYVMIIAEFLEKITINKKFTSELRDNQDGDTQFNFLRNINLKIKDFHERLYRIFNKNLLKDKWEYRSEIIPSITCANLTPYTKKVRIYIKDIIDFLKQIQPSENDTLKINHYQVFNLFEKNKTLKPIIYNQTLQLTFFLDIRFLLDPKIFCEQFSEEISNMEEPIKQDRNRKDDFNFSLARCKFCHLLLPRCFIIGKERETSLYKRFEDKVSNEEKKFILNISEVLIDPAFPKKNDRQITSINALLEAVKTVAENKTSENTDSSKDVRSALEDLVTKETDMDKTGVETVQFRNLRSQIFKHLQNKHKHFKFITKFAKVLHEIDLAQQEYIKKLTSINNDLELAANAMCESKNSLEFLDNNNELRKSKEAELTHVRIKSAFKTYPNRDRFGYKMIEETFLKLKRQKILLIYAEGNNDQYQIQMSANMTTNVFNINVLKKENQDIIKNHVISFEEFVYHSVNSNCFSCLEFQGIGKFNSAKLFEMVNHHINDYREAKGEKK